MINTKELLQKIESGDVSYEDKLAALGQVETALKEMRERKETILNDRVGMIVDALKTMQRKVEAQLEEAKAIVPEVGPAGPKGEPGERGLDGASGRDGRDGVDGRNGVDGQDGVSVTDAKIDFDGSLIITLSTGREINVGEVVAPDLAEKIKVITNGGGTSQSVLDTLASLQTQIDNLIPSQTGNSGKFLTTNGTTTSWATVSGSGAVDSVNGQTGVVVLDAADVGAEPADATILKDADIGVTVQGYSAVLAGTTASFTTADETKLDGIEAGADVTDAANVEPLVDAHLNTATATTDQVLSWNGTDYDWVDQSGGGGGGTLTISNKTAAYTVVAGDLGTIINCTSGTFSVSLTAAATLGAGFNCWIWNTSATATDAITIDPSATETVDGKTTIILRRNEGVQIICDGTNWQTGSKKAMRAYAENIATAYSRPVASGDTALALGAGATASGSESLAAGRGVTASANFSSAIATNSAGNGSQAVTGAGAMALGGSYASGADSFAAGVANNTSSYGATGPNSVAIGQQNKATGYYSAAIGGTNNTASGSWSIASGTYSNASKQFSIALGQGAVANVNGKFAYSSQYLGSDFGSAQNGLLNLGKQTTDSTPTVLVSNSSSASTDNQVILPNNSAYAFSGIIVARQQAAGGSNYAAWEIKGAILRDGTAASTVLGSVSINTLSKTAGATAWVVALTADTTNGGLAVTVTGAAATNIRWVATVQTSEVTYA